MPKTPPKTRKEDNRIALLHTERLAIAKLVPHPRNPRKHPPPDSAEWATLKASLEHDYFDPVVWNKRNGMLVSGHLRAKVMKEMGVTEADVVVVDYDEPTHLARMSAANQQQGEDNNILLTQLLQDVEKEGISVMIAGFTQAGVKDLMARAKVDADRAFLDNVPGAVPGPRTNASTELHEETFPLVVVFTAEQHQKVMDIIGRAREQLKEDDLQQVTLRIYDHFDKTVLRKKKK